MLYLKIFKKNFVCCDEKLGSSLEATLIPVGLRYIRWCNGRVLWEKECQNENKVPDGWELSYDVDLRLEGRVRRLSIHSATAVRDFQPYLRKLASEGKRLEEVVTRLTITSRRKLNLSVRFETVG